MLCPNCGTNVGDRATLCPTCAEARRASAATAEPVGDVRPGNPAHGHRTSNIQILLGGIVALSLVLAVSLLIANYGRSKAFSALTAAQQAEVDTLYKRCKSVGEDALKMSKEISQQGGGVIGAFGSAVTSMASISGTTARQCGEVREICEHDFNGDMCRQQRQVTALFFVMQNVCHLNGIKSLDAMSSPDCQALYQICVGGDLEGADCQALIKRHGA